MLGVVALIAGSLGNGAWAATVPRSGSLRPAGPAVPAAGILLGAFVDLKGGWSGVQAAQDGVTTRERQLGRRLDIDHHFYPFDNPWPWPGPLEQWDRDNGRIPLVTWDGTQPKSIINGSQDAVLRDRARQVTAFRAPIFVRFSPEMNADWSAMNASRTGNDPSLFVRAWRHVVSVFRREGATNAIFVWSPNATDEPRTPWNHWTRYYPGDTYADWVGIDGYNWGSTLGGSWESFAAIMQPIYHDFGARKPIMIAETSSVERDGSSKARWITDARDWMKSHPAIAAFVWFDIAKERNWRIDSTAASFSAFRSLARDAYFTPVGRASLAASAP
jgi:hypothetical protein